MGGGAAELGEPGEPTGTRAGGPTRRSVHSRSGVQAEASGFGADFVKGAVQVSQPVGDDGVGVAEDVIPELEGEEVVGIVAEAMRVGAIPSPRLTR